MIFISEKYITMIDAVMYPVFSMSNFNSSSRFNPDVFQNFYVTFSM